jgi:hypothetical protein
MKVQQSKPKDIFAHLLSLYQNGIDGLLERVFSTMGELCLHLLVLVFSAVVFTVVLVNNSNPNGTAGTASLYPQSLASLTTSLSTAFSEESIKSALASLSTVSQQAITQYCQAGLPGCTPNAVALVPNEL